MAASVSMERTRHRDAAGAIGALELSCFVYVK